MKTLVAFQIGRGGRFNNGGHLSVKSFNTPINDYLVEHCFLIDDVWRDQNGESLELDHDNNGVGRVEFDSEYNTIYVKHLEDCDYKEICVIWDDEYGYDLYLEELNIKDFEILRKFKVKAEDVFWNEDDIFDTCSAEMNNIEEISEEEIYDVDNYEEINGKFYTRYFY